MNNTTSPTTSAIADAISEVVLSAESRHGGFLVSLPRTSGDRQVRARKPRAGNEYDDSFFRPRVLARDRLLFWTSAYGCLQASEARSFLSHAAFDHLQHVKLSSIEPSTREVYGAGLLRFTQYCDAFNIPEFDRVPASDMLLAGFVLAGAGKVGSAQQWISGLELWHKMQGAPWLGAGELKAALAGVKKLAPSSSHRPPRPPVTHAHLKALLDGLDFSNTLDASVWAAASIAFWSCCRLGELLLVSSTDFHPARNVTHGAPLNFGRSQNGTRYATLHIPFSKTTSTEGADISITDIADRLSPLVALEFHLRINDTIPRTAPFFAFAQGDSWLPLTKDILLQRCNDVWRRAGLEVISGGHSFRIGGATELLLMGVAPDVVAKQGRWLSDAFLLYWRKIQEIVPFFISQSFSGRDPSYLHVVMDKFEQGLGS